MSTPSSTQKVLQTYELLERILSFLPFHDLFTLSRVSKTWHSLLSRSTTLLQLKYISPSDTPLKPLDSSFDISAGRTRVLYDPAPVRLNPAAEILGLINEGNARGLITFGISDQNVFLQFDIKGFPVYEKRILGLDASWRNMLLTQPPVTAVNFEFIRREGHGGPVTVWSKEGVAFGQVHDWSVRLAEEYEIETGKSAEVTFESVSFCLMHPHSVGDGVEEAW